MNERPQATLTPRQRLRLLLGTLFYPLGLFWPAGTLAWPQAWIFLALMGLFSVVTYRFLRRHDPALLQARAGLRFHRDQPLSDKLFFVAFLPTALAWLPVMGFDRRFGWSDVALWLQVAGGLLLAAALVLLFQVFAVNRYLVPVVRLQVERGHRVVDTGPYAVVRHPMYTAMAIFFAGSALLLGSWAGLAVALLLSAQLAVRCVFEERHLRRTLEGYPAYQTRVRYRLIPGIW